MYDSFSLTPYFIITINELQCLDSQRVSISIGAAAGPAPPTSPLSAQLYNLGPVTVTHRDDEVSYHFKAKNFILEFGSSVRKSVKVIYSDSFLGEAERAEESVALVEAVLARLQVPGPVLVLDNAPGPGAGAAFCALVAVAQQIEAEQHCDVYVYLHYL